MAPVELVLLLHSWNEFLCVSYGPPGKWCWMNADLWGSMSWHYWENLYHFLLYLSDHDFVTCWSLTLANKNRWWLLIILSEGLNSICQRTPWENGLHISCSLQHSQHLAQWLVWVNTEKVLAEWWNEWQEESKRERVKRRGGQKERKGTVLTSVLNSE